MCHVLILQLIFFLLVFLLQSTSVHYLCEHLFSDNVFQPAFERRLSARSVLILILILILLSFLVHVVRFIPGLQIDHGVLVFVCMICAYVCFLCITSVFAIKCRSISHMQSPNGLWMVVFRRQRHWIISILYNLILCSFTLCASVCVCVGVRMCVQSARMQPICNRELVRLILLKFYAHIHMSCMYQRSESSIHDSVCFVFLFLF